MNGAETRNVVSAFAYIWGLVVRISCDELVVMSSFGYAIVMISKIGD